MKQGVLVTDGDERSTLAVTRSLGRQGVPVFVGAEAAGSLAGSSRYCTQSFTYPSPWLDPEGYLACLAKKAAEFDATAIFPMTEIAMELIGERRADLTKIAALPFPALDQYHLLSDKYRLTTWAERAGIPVPKTIFVPDGRILGLVERIDSWPVVVKPGRSLLRRDGYWRKSEVLIAHDAAELQEFYSDRWFLKQPSMIQRYIPGHGEGVFGLFRTGNPSVLFAHRRLRERPPSGGVSVLREAIALPEPMTAYAVRTMQFARWDGVAMIEFKVDRETQVPYLMEVNGRFWGSLQLAIDAGIDFPALLYNSVTGTGAPAELQPYRVGTRSHWWLGGVDHLLARLRNPAGELSLSPGAGSRGAALVSLVNVFDIRAKNEIFRTSDLAPGMNELAAYGRRLLTSISTKFGNRARSAYRKMRHALIDVGLKAGLNRKALGKRFPQRARTVLVLCKGNICRSPFVDKYLTIAARQRALDLRVSSAGLDANAGRQAHPLALERSFKVGVPLDEHRAQAVSETLVNEADVILVMEPDQQEELIARFPQAAEKTFLLGHFDPERPLTEIADPYGMPAAEFDACYARLSAACDGFLARLVPASKVV